MKVIPFEFNGQKVRTIEKDGEPWFVAKDVARVLGYTNPQKAVRDHCKGMNETFIPSVGGSQRATIIPERDVYRLIMRSKLPAAEAFEEWVVGTVLPSIRRTGAYSAPSRPLTAVEALERALAQARKAEVLEKQVEILKPSTEFGEQSKATNSPRVILIGGYYRSGKGRVEKALEYLRLADKGDQLEFELEQIDARMAQQRGIVPFDVRHAA